MIIILSLWTPITKPSFCLSFCLGKSVLLSSIQKINLEMGGVFTFLINQAATLIWPASYCCYIVSAHLLLNSLCIDCSVTLFFSLKTGSTQSEFRVNGFPSLMTLCFSFVFVTYLEPESFFGGPSRLLSSFLFVLMGSLIPVCPL